MGWQWPYVRQVGAFGRAGCSGRGWVGFLQLDEKTPAALGVKEGDFRSSGSADRFLMDELNPLLAKEIKGLLNVVHAEAEMMETFAALSDESRDRRIRRKSLEKFEPNLTDWEEGNIHFFGFYALSLLED